MPSATLTPGASSIDSSLTQLTNKKLARLFNDDKVVTLMIELELGAFQRPDGSVLVGLLDSEVHPHDRWLWEFRQGLIDATGLMGEWGWVWYTAAASLDLSCAGKTSPAQPLKAEVVKQMLAFYRSSIGQIRMRLLLHEGRPVDAHEVLAGMLALDSTDVNDIVEIDYSLSLVDIHDIVHHQEEFLARHPDHVGIPRQHLLRLYGLADPYRAVRAGRENA